MQFPRAERWEALQGERTSACKRTRGERSKLWMGVMINRLSWLKRRALLRNNENRNRVDEVGEGRVAGRMRAEVRLKAK